MLYSGIVNVCAMVNIKIIVSYKDMSFKQPLTVSLSTGSYSLYLKPIFVVVL